VLRFVIGRPPGPSEPILLAHFPLGVLSIESAAEKRIVSFYGSKWRRKPAKRDRYQPHYQQQFAFPLTAEWNCRWIGGSASETLNRCKAGIGVSGRALVRCHQPPQLLRELLNLLVGDSNLPA
jgi:hypothetical protein